ncbi:unnamed protein product, partial [Prorocentrum cordatum]
APAPAAAQRRGLRGAVARPRRAAAGARLGRGGRRWRGVWQGGEGGGEGGVGPPLRGVRGVRHTGALQAGGQPDRVGEPDRWRDRRGQLQQALEMGLPSRVRRNPGGSRQRADWARVSR